MRIEYADQQHNGTEPEEVTWARTINEARKKAEDYEKRAAILRLMGEPGKAEKMEKKAHDLRAEALKMEIRGAMGASPEESAADTRKAQKRMLQIEMR